ncbi:ribonuclease P ASCRUDRAFT_98221 [Ascoidea rubescens DSM 1968]|uniref:Ribonucleases P/MRP subunit Pop8-like domain-containing protein n=1 Tax=Ascoidea rubescens DSM 1968 TaxID=1344418 RepID=A0A1D2VQ05_9ASCO|nr:hypothetical protein ASCRUDRAFT_98221 [Ascoidea rubescens DSM 1968]ODV63713.1 hypothetical protein ASCRUDRAFT_98221 [Ascoidea rubescens DSM 1968]
MSAFVSLDGFEIEDEGLEWWYLTIQLIISPKHRNNEVLQKKILETMDYISWRTLISKILKKFFGIMGESTPIDYLKVINSPNSYLLFIRIHKDDKLLFLNSIMSSTFELDFLGLNEVTDEKIYASMKMVNETNNLEELTKLANINITNQKQNLIINE